LWCSHIEWRLAGARCRLSCSDVDHGNVPIAGKGWEKKKELERTRLGRSNRLPVFASRRSAKKTVSSDLPPPQGGDRRGLAFIQGRRALAAMVTAVGTALVLFIGVRRVQSGGPAWAIWSWLWATSRNCIFQRS
jgi:hypothetical protein